MKGSPSFAVFITVLVETDSDITFVWKQNPAWQSVGTEPKSSGVFLVPLHPPLPPPVGESQDFTMSKWSIHTCALA